MSRRRLAVDRIVEALGISVRRRGRLHWASCPKRFDEAGNPDPHRDSDASWRIVLDTNDERYGQHRCYGCGFGGYAVHLVEGVLGLSREQANEWLEAYSSGDVLPTTVEVVELERMIFGAPFGNPFRLPPEVVQGDPTEWPLKVRRYVASRGVTPEQAEKWRIGYALAGTLAGRVVIPVYDSTGRLISYTGRSFTGSKLRYRNARLEDGADLTAIFGEEMWPDQPADGSPVPGTVIICEGGLNALACERAAPDCYQGAIFGSQLWPLHVLKVSRFEKVIIASDPDAAGNKVASELLDALQRSKVGRLVLPAGVDCNDLDRDDLASRIAAVRSTL